MSQKKLIPALLLGFLGLTGLYSTCGPDPVPLPSCTEQITNSPRSVHFFAFRAACPYFNQVVASFKFNQSSKSFSGTTSCPASQCSTTLIIQNATSRKITFDYKITFTLNFVKWDYQGVAIVDAGAALNVGEVSNSCTSLSLGQIVIQSASITYQ